MRRAGLGLAVLWLAGLAMLASAVTLGAATARVSKTPYAGNVTSASGEIQFLRVRREGKLGIERFHADNLTVVCTGGSSTENLRLRKIAVHGRRFHVEGVISFRGQRVVELEGRLRRGGRADGTLRIFRGLDEIPVCDTGPLTWEASR